MEREVDLSRLLSCVTGAEPFRSKEEELLTYVMEALRRRGPEEVEAFCRTMAGQAAELASYSPPPAVDADSARWQLELVSARCSAATQLLLLLCDPAVCGRLGRSLTYRLAACSR